MVRIEPCPRGEAKEIISCIKLQPLDVFFHNIDIFFAFSYIFDPKSTLIIVLLTSCDFFIDDFKIFNLVPIVLAISILIVGILMKVF